MTTGKIQKGYQERLEDFISFAKSVKPGQIEVNLHKEVIKQLTHPEETDNLKVEKDLYLLMADFTMTGAPGERQEVAKVYAFGAINETEVEEKVIRNIANERLKIDYQRFRDAKIEYQEKFF
jgi:hypothetical protein